MRTWPAVDVHRLSEPDLLQAALTDFDVAAIDERTDDSWRVFFLTADARDRAAEVLPQSFPAMQFEAVDVPDEDWAARSQAALRAVTVGNIVVAPPWDVPTSDQLTAMTRRGAKPQVIVIQPSMGFGTGHHPTTRLCLSALQQFNVKGGTIIDVGTGSGVLAIAAHRLGAARVIAIDDDPDAIAAACENAQRNGATIDTRVADLRHIALSRFDLVLANLTGGLLMQSAGRLQDLTTPRGPMILSGFTREEEPAVLAAFPRLVTVDRVQKDVWVCVTLQRETAFQ